MTKRVVRYKRVNGALVKQYETPPLVDGLVDIASLPVVGTMGSAIVETGENANGRWVKWADGTMICSAIITKTLSIETNYNIGASVTWEWTYPSAFVGVVPVAFCGGWFIKGVNEGWMQVNTNGLSGASGRIFSQANLNLTDVTLSICAMGQWK